MSRLYLRKWQVLVSKDGATCLDTTHLDVKFALEKAMSASGNSGTVMVYNMSKNSIKRHVEKGGRVIVSAGYQDGPYGGIFDGDIIDFRTYLDGNVTKVLEMAIKDGDKFLNGFVSEAYGAGMDTGSLLGTFNGKIDPDISLGNVSPNLKNAPLPRGKVLHGTPRQIIGDLAKTEDGVFYINDRKIHLSRADDPPTGSVYSLTPTSGLIGTPTQTEEGIQAKCLLIPALNLNKFVHISSEYVGRSLSTDGSKAQAALKGSGIYRIAKIKYTGDSGGNDWYCEITGLAQPGMKPEGFNNFTK